MPATPATPTTPPTPIAAPIDAASPLRCLNCRYDLRAHPAAIGDPADAPSADCPECGCPVAVSRRLDPLANAPLAHRRRLALGATLLVVAVAIALPLVLPGLLLAIAAAWLLTAAEPDRFEPSRDRIPRLYARLALPLGVAACVGVGVVTLVAIGRFGLSISGQLTTIDVAILAAGALTVTGLLALFRHLTHTALRHDPALATHLRRLHRAWLLAIAAIGVVALLAGAFDWAYRVFSIRYVATAPIMIAVVAAILLWLWAVTLRTATHLRAALKPLADAQDSEARRIAAEPSPIG
ncbi:MAG: hypothetical protein AAF078_05490 [Planctomycetota bacterium]